MREIVKNWKKLSIIDIEKGIIHDQVCVCVCVCVYTSMQD